MDISEKHGLSSAFYFITAHSAGTLDGLYTMQHPEIRRLLRNIHAENFESVTDGSVCTIDFQC
jgi:hypothetical protein